MPSPARPSWAGRRTRRSGWRATSRTPPPTCYPGPPIPSPDLCDDVTVSERTPTGRTPAWLWYGLAVASLVVLAVLDLVGVLDRLGP